MSSYEDLLEQLYSKNLSRGIKLGLSNPQKLDQLLGYPSRRFRSVHIAGSNGKGSVATKIAKGLEASGYKTGLYTSPHISSFRERIQINGKLISEKETATLLQKILEQDVPATFFEITTLLAFLFFAEEEVDYAVVETGLGGRLDATNILAPDLAVITSLSLEHTEILGNSLDLIAKEKAGILKPGCPAVLGPSAARILPLSQEPATLVEGPFPSFMEENSAIAAKAMELLSLTPAAISKGIQATPPCRFQIIEGASPIILDVAHNPDAFKQLFSLVRSRFQKPIRLLLGLSKQKDIAACMKIIHEYVDAIQLLDIPHPRLLSPEELAPYAPNAGIAPAAEAITAANEAAKRNGEVIVAAGSFFIMDSVRRALGICNERDPLSLQENWQIK